NDQTSSLRRPLGRENAQDGIARAHAVAGMETIRTERLDTFLPAHGIDAAGCFLKLDVQGHEMSVLKGAGALLGRFPLLQIELSMRPIYAGETGFGEFVDFIQRQGFRVRALRPNYFDPDDDTLAQVDLIAEGPQRPH